LLPFSRWKSAAPKLPGTSSAHSEPSSGLVIRISLSNHF
jgi:hypothetical protein